MLYYYYTAPTGVASFSIGGETLHSALGLCPKQSYRRLLEGGISSKTRDRLENLQLLFIDEFSMVGARFLSLISKWLSKVKNNELPFGSVSVVLIGHLHQLAPIKDYCLWTDPSKICANGDAFLKDGLNLYRKFNHFLGLTIPVRQQGDQRFQQLLSNLERKCLTQEDMDLLLSRRLSVLHIHKAPLFVFRSRC